MTAGSSSQDPPQPSTRGSVRPTGGVPAASVPTGAVPNAVVVGPQRAGTTWIHRYLLHRDDVGVSRRVKEVYYFDRYYECGNEWYATHFSGSEGRSRVVDVTPTYFPSHEARGRMQRDLGNVPIVCTLRHPAKRAFSMYLLFRRYGSASRTFREAAAELPMIIESNRYATHLAEWRRLFGPDRVKVLFLEALEQDPNQYARELCDHLEIPFAPVDESLAGSPNPNNALPVSSTLARLGLKLGDWARYHRMYGLIEFGRKLGLRSLLFGKAGTVAIPSLTEEDFSWFMSQIEGEIERLEAMLQIELPAWREFPQPRTAAAATVSDRGVASPR